MTSATPLFVPSVPVQGPEHLILGFARDVHRPARLVAVGGQRVDVVLLSEDRGRTWQALPSPGKGLRGAHLDGDTLWVCGEYGTLAVSRDGGTTFTALDVGTSGCLFGVAVDDEGVVWVCGDGGFVVASVDDGATFQRVNGARVSLSRAHRSPYGVLVPTDAPGDLLVLTSPKRKPTLRRIGIGAGGDLMTATTTPRGTVVVVGAGGACWRSVDGAQTFTAVDSGTTQLLCGVCATAEGRVFAVGAGGTVIVSDDDGLTFAPAHTGLSGTLWCVVAVDDDVFVGGEGGLIARLVPLEQALAAAAAAPVVRRDLVPGVIVDDTLRAMVRPWRGAPPALFVPPPPLPSTSTAWSTARALFWASDRYRTALTAKDSVIWGLAIAPTARSRRFADRLLDEAYRPIDDDVALALAKAAFLDEFRGPLSEQLADAVADLLVAAVGLEGAVVAALRGLPRELPYTGVGLFGRLRERAALASDADYAALLQRVPAVVDDEIARDPKNSRRAIHLLSAASFLLPPGEDPHDVERHLLGRAAARIGRFGDLDIAHAGLLASGDADVMATFLAKNTENRHELFAGGVRPYLATMLARGVPLLRERLPDLRPRHDLAVDVWATLLARVDGERAIHAVFAQRRTKPARGIDVALAFRASLGPEAMRHLLVAEAGHLAADDVAGRAALEGLLAPRTAPVPLGHDAVVRCFGAPSSWQPPPSLKAATLHVPAGLALPPTLDFTEDEIAEAAARQPSDGHWRWQADSVVDSAPGGAGTDDSARDLVRNLRGPDADAYVAFRERWRLPTPSALYQLLPTRLHERLLALGIAAGDGQWHFWPGALLKGGDVVLPGLRAFVSGDADLEHRLQALMPVGDVACIGPVVEAFSGKKHKALARQWILRHRRHAIAGALTLLVVDDVAAAVKTGAARVLRFLDGLGARDAILALARGHDAALETRVTALLDEDPLLQPGAKVPSLPSYAQPAVLPKLITRDGRTLADDEAGALLVRLAVSNADEVHPALLQAKRTLTSSSLAALARALFEAWLREGADPKHGWCMLAVGVCGDDALVRELAALVKTWPGESAAARAQQGLDVLVVHGGDVALLQVSLIAEKSKFAALKKGAVERIGAIAERRGLSRDELADRLVPTFGLDDDAGCVLDFGARRFTVTFDEQLVPRVKDDGGVLLKDLPKPGKSDDAALAKAAKARFSGLKKDVKTVADVLLRRLERAMLEGRAFDVDVFRGCFVEHPLAFHVARRLVWEARDADGRRLGLFRIAEDRTFADVDDSLWTLPRGASVVVVHPLELDEATLGRFTALFGDYGLLQPFAQLGRPCHRVDDAERAVTSLRRFAGRALPAPKLVFGLEGRGWRREGAGDGGSFSSHDRELRGVRATVHYEGAVAMGFIEEGELLTLDEVTFTTTRPLTIGDRTIPARTALALGDVPPALLSEVVKDLEGLLGQ